MKYFSCSMNKIAENARSSNYCLSETSSEWTGHPFTCGKPSKCWMATNNRSSICHNSFDSQSANSMDSISFAIITIQSEKWTHSPRFPHRFLVILTTHLQLFNYIVEGFIVYTGFDKRMKEELQVCFTSMPSQKLNTISISDFLYLIDVLVTSSIQLLIH